MLRIPYKSPTGKDMREAIARRCRWIEEELKKPEVQARLDAAHAEAVAVARMLKERFGATRVRLFGSLARRDEVEGFDIDVAVEGLASRDYFRAWGEAEKLVTRKLDLIDLKDELPPLLRKRIEQDGVDLL